MLMSTQGPAVMYGVTTTFTILDFIAVGLRFCARRAQQQPLKADDWLVLPALALNFGISVAIWYGVSQQAVGYPTPPITQTRSFAMRTPLNQVSETISTNEKVFFVVYTMFAASLTFTKSSILCFYRRIFCYGRPERDIFNITISFMLVVVAMFGISITFANIFACGIHVDTWWATAGSKLKENCIDTQMLTYAHSVSDFIIDSIIILMWIPMVWRLHLELKRKLGVIAMFLTASLAVIASLMKMSWFLWENETPWNPSFDQDELASTFLFWTAMETHVGLVAVCLPTLRAVFKEQSSIQQFINKARSKISLGSLPSRLERNNSSPRVKEGRRHNSWGSHTGENNAQQKLPLAN